MIVLPVMLSVAIASVFAVKWLASRGLARLAGDRKHGESICLTLWAGSGSLAGLLCCIFLMWPGIEFNLQLIFCIPYMTLLMTAAYIDLTSFWAPLELMLPIAGLTFILASGCMANTTAGLLQGTATGILLYLAAWLAWHCQGHLRCLLLPPADTLALLMPLILFGAHLASGIYYLMLSIGLLALWLVASRGRTVAQSPDAAFRFIPLLALAFPLTALFSVTLALPWPRPGQ
ncbi:MAG: hypothetical protein OXC91_14395 [Rhodobacteraceae bacterium]|nr:hypothetical protein [Paracoccaceae bacterium]